ncbi:TylF/MycF family methyltransferase [bacterium]|nr:TylF/MycF family methyltransferase [bacterium]
MVVLVRELQTLLCLGKTVVRILKQKTGVELPDGHIVQGFYCDSLTPELQARMPKAGVIHIDVDLYSSTVDVLRFLKPLLVPGSLLVFDDWYAFPGGGLMGERRALTEFLEANPGFAVEPWKAYSTFG